MPKLDDLLDDLEAKVEDERREEAALGREIDAEAEQAGGPSPQPDHASDGGVI